MKVNKVIFAFELCNGIQDKKEMLVHYQPIFSHKKQVKHRVPKNKFYISKTNFFIVNKIRCL